MTSFRPLLALTALFAFIVAFGTSTEAGCNCRADSPPMTPVPMPAPSTPPGPYTNPYVGPYADSYGPPPQPGPPQPSGARCERCNIGQYDPGPPPGTLGQTYNLCSRKLPDDEHPRNAGLEIRTADVTRIDVEKMEGYLGDDELWHFTTEKPWIPGRPAIVRVVLERAGDGQPVKDVRVVRLIPGRILFVEF